MWFRNSIVTFEQVILSKSTSYVHNNLQKNSQKVLTFAFYLYIIFSQKTIDNSCQLW